MSFNKLTTFKIERTDIEVLDGELIKTASVKLPDGHSYDPDYIYLRVKAVSAGEAWGSNKNDDYFPEKELKEWFKTFLTAHVFKNHENKKIEDSIGDVLIADWVDDMKSVYLTIRIDKRIAPTIVRGFEKGFMTDVSMGCRVDHVICSYCGKSAKTRLDYCEHLKSMKGKVMDDGRKVYEINIGPKFHDISAVLNGAERSAKAEGIVIMGDKVAFNESEGLEKKASFEESAKECIDVVTATNQRMHHAILMASNNMRKVASDKAGKDISLEWAKESLKAKTLTESLKGSVSTGLDSLSEIVELVNRRYTKYMDKYDCEQIGCKLRDIAKTNFTSIDHVLTQFLKVIDLAAITLSPKEIHYILMEALDRDTLSLEDSPLCCTDDDAKSAPEVIDELSSEAGIGGCISAIRGLLDDCDTNGHDKLTINPKGKIMSIIVSSKPVHQKPDDIMMSHIMRDVVSPLLGDRSNHRKFLIPRLSEISSGSACTVDSSREFLPIKMTKLPSASSSPETVIPMILSAILSSAHENERVASFNSGELFENMQKFASYFDDLYNVGVCEKNAAEIKLGGSGKKINPYKVIFNGIPVIYSYSALQRSRLNNGEDISSMNRFVAENPSNAAFLYSLVAPVATKTINHYAPVIKDAVTSMIKKAYEETDILNSKEVDSQMIKAGYSVGNVKVAKYACVLSECGYDDLADNVILNAGVNPQITDDYLKTASACFKIDLEKKASQLDIDSFNFHLNDSPESILFKDMLLADKIITGIKHQ